jgi:hypothetical protein
VDRKGPKTSIAPGDVEEFDSLADLADAVNSDDDMTNHNPTIERDTMERTNEENRNVRVPVWIYAIKYESDQDWHVILGTDPSVSGPKTFFNAEISGVPANAAPSRATLLAVRESLDQILENDLPSSSGYRKYDDPIPVLVEGSLFFDIDHQAGVVGPTGMRPQTAWKIHAHHQADA